MKISMRSAFALLCVLAVASAQSAFPAYAWTYTGSGNSSGVESSIASRVNSNGETIVFWSSFSDFVVAAKAKTGEIVWYNSDIGELLRSTPAVYEFTSTHAGIFVIGGDAQLWCLDADTGKKIWAVPTGGKKQEFQASSPAVFGSMILFGSLDGNVKAVKAVDGSPVWQLPTQATIYSSVHLGLESVAPGAMTLGCIGSDDGALYVFEAASGKLRWKKNTGAFIRGTCTFYSDVNFNGGNAVAFFGSNSRSVFAVDAVTGKQLWVFSTPNGDDYATPTIHRFDNGTVTLYVSSYDYNLYALDAASGQPMWNFTTLGYVIASPLVFNGKVYVGCDQTLSESAVYSIDASSGALIAQAFVENNPVWSSARAIDVAGTNQTLIMLGDQGGDVWAFYP